MLTTHFKRQGSAGLLILKGLKDKYYIEYEHMRGSLKAQRNYTTLKTFNGKQYNESSSETILFKKYDPTTEPIDNFKDIENSINEVVEDKITIENFIESYYISGQRMDTYKILQNDRDIINNIDVTNKTVQEVITECNINLNEFFAQWKCNDLSELLKNPTHELLNLKFADLYYLIHWHNVSSCQKEVAKIKELLLITN